MSDAEGRVLPPDDEWDATVQGWKDEFEAMTLPDLIASFGPVADESENDDD